MTAGLSGWRRSLTLQSLASQALALVPLVVAVTFAALVLPRSVAPDEIPQPTIDARALAAVQAEDDSRAARARETPLPGRVRSVGSAYRAFNTAEAAHADEPTLAQAHEAIFRALRQTSDADIESLRALRAVELEGFLVEVRRFERTGEVTDELLALGGTFVDRMRLVGWCVGRRLLMPEPALRAAFKLTWNRSLDVNRDPRFAETVDETRALYAFYFAHPRASEGREASQTTAPVKAATAHEPMDDKARKANASWLLGKVDELARVDPSYPAVLGRAAALFMRHDYHASALLYEGWLEGHPDGLWTLRVQNHLRAALLAENRVFR